ncbi:MAG: hypothetical protein U1E17_06980 [Geminicoccaceae bacterium]
MVLWKERAEANRLTMSSSSIAVTDQGPSTSAAAVKKVHPGPGRRLAEGPYGWVIAQVEKA